MSYPLINGWILNSAVINGGGSTAPVVGPPGDFVGAAISLRPTKFGVPRAAIGVDAVAHPKSLCPTRFGTPMVLADLQPSDAAFPAKSLTAGKFGVASFASTLQTGPVQSLQSARFGALAMRVALAASSLSPAQFGTPSVAIRACASSLRPVRFGSASTEHSLAAASLCSTRFGAPALHLDSLALAAQSFRPVQFGVPSLGSMAMCARTMRPVRFGQPALDRGAIC